MAKEGVEENHAFGRAINMSPGTAHISKFAQFTLKSYSSADVPVSTFKFCGGKLHLALFTQHIISIHAHIS